MSDVDDIFGEMIESAPESVKKVIQSAAETKEKKVIKKKKSRKGVRGKSPEIIIENDLVKVIISPPPTQKIIKEFNIPIAVCVYGPKGVGKSLIAYGFNKGIGKFAILDFDGNTRLTIEKNIKKVKHENFKIWNIKGMINFSKLNKAKLTKHCYEVTKKIDKIWEEIEAYEPNFIVFDGYQRGVWLSEQSMRFIHDADPFGGVKNRNAWKERNFTLDKWFSSAQQIAKDAIIITVHEKLQSSADDSEESEREPKWSGAVKEETQVVIRAKQKKLDVMTDDLSFLVDVESNKLTGKTTANLDVTRAPYKFYDWILDDDFEPMF